VIPVGFVSDHMEVRHDLDVEARQAAESLGLAFARATTPGSHPRFASMVTELVKERLALPDSPGPDSQACPADCCRYVVPAGRPGGASSA
jgi:ferrochelatase